MLWQQQYLHCCEELGQWDVVNDYARGTENYAAYMDVAWKCSDWQGLKDWVLPKGAVEDSPRVSMIKAFVLLQDGDVTQANMHTENAITQTLHRWLCFLFRPALVLEGSIGHGRAYTNTSAARSSN